MSDKKTNFVALTRASFLTSVIAPLTAGTLLSYLYNPSWDWINYILLLIMGMGLHIATNVYNDIYDTRQGTDRVNAHRNPFSGGSGVLLGAPDLATLMFRIARAGLLAALVSALGLTFRIQDDDRLIFWILVLLSAFLSKYYTAAPVKLAYRGLGEFFVWLAFGPMAILAAMISQHAELSEPFILAMPLTGLSTLSILLLGQMIDRPADAETGKRGLAVRIGNRKTALVYMAVQGLLCLNLVVLALKTPEPGIYALLPLVPYALFLPRIVKDLQQPKEPSSIIRAAGKNVQLHLGFSLMLIAGLALAKIF